VATISALVAPYALASNIGDLQTQARDLEAHINELGNQENQLSERYDAGVIALKATEVGVTRAQGQVAAADTRANRALSVLQADAVDAYVNNGSGSLDGTGLAGSIAGANSSLLRAEYAQSLATDQSAVEDQYRLASKQANRAESNLKTQEAGAAANLRTIVVDEKQVQAAQVTLVSVEAQVKGRIATLIAQQLAAERRAAQLAAERRLAAARAAAARQSVGRGGRRPGRPPDHHRADRSDADAATRVRGPFGCRRRGGGGRRVPYRRPVRVGRSGPWHLRLLRADHVGLRPGRGGAPALQRVAIRSDGAHLDGGPRAR
jgi:hypothetical protein